MIVTAAFEFNPQFSKLIPPRPTDDEELTEVLYCFSLLSLPHPLLPSPPLQLIRKLPHITVKIKEPVLREPCAIKACILLHAHLEKIGLPPGTLRPGTTCTVDCSAVWRLHFFQIRKPC